MLVELTTDNNPLETGLQVVLYNPDGSGEFTPLLKEDPGKFTASGALYEFHIDNMPLDGQYGLILTDTAGNGMCCQNGLGEVNLFQVDKSVYTKKERIGNRIIGLFSDQRVITFQLDPNFFALSVSEADSHN